MEHIIAPIASRLHIQKEQIIKTLQLLKEGNTVPFIARYRKEVTKGLDVVHEIEKISVGANDKPVEDVVIESIKVDTKGIEYKEPEKVK